MRLFFLLLTLCPCTLLAQFTESFADGNLLEQPTWHGHLDHFLHTADQQLQLNAPQAGTSTIWCESKAIEQSRWELTLKMGFNPSSNNYCRVYLAAHQTDFTATPTNTVVLDIGRAGDRLQLVEIINGKETVIINGLENRLNTAPINLQISIERTHDTWSLSANSGDGWQTEGQADYLPEFSSTHFGIQCNYTATRADKFWFDDIQVIGQPFSDRIPPKIFSLEQVNGSLIRLFCSEAIHPQQPTDLITWHNGNLYPYTATIDSENNNIVNLNFTPSLPDLQNDSLIINNLSDLAGNKAPRMSFPISYIRTKVMNARLMNDSCISLLFSINLPPVSFNKGVLTINNEPSDFSLLTNQSAQTHVIKLAQPLKQAESHGFSISNLIDDRGDTLVTYSNTLFFYPPKRFDIVLNELMADPTPSMDLPEYEFLEFYNASPHPVQLTGWSLLINDKTSQLPDLELPSGAYIVFSPQAMDGINHVQLSSWLTLTNDGFTVALLDNNKTVIDAFRYSPAQLSGEPFKSEGGWTAERIDPTNHSGVPHTWQWSHSLTGGTPGKANSVAADLPDTDSPTLTDSQLTKDGKLRLRFDEAIQLPEQHLITMNNSGEHLTTLNYDTLLLKEITLQLPFTPVLNTPYLINLKGTTDLAGNTLEPDLVRVALADSVRSGDVIINEVLFDPFTGGTDFVELLNTSDRILHTHDLYLASVSNNVIEKLHSLPYQQRLLYPGEFLVLTKDSSLVMRDYPNAKQLTMANLSSFPSLPDDGGVVCLATSHGAILDRLDYTNEMLGLFVKTYSGCSLERISINASSLDANNWAPSADEAGATPGYINSQSATWSSSNKTVWLEPQVFSPYNNSTVQRIHYNNEEADGVANIMIYDLQGRQIIHLISNVLMAKEGFFIWDGRDASGQPAPPGNYIIFMQRILSTGNTIENKMVSTIAVVR